MHRNYKNWKEAQEIATINARCPQLISLGDRVSLSQLDDDNKRLATLYTGINGRRSQVVEALLNNPPSDVPATTQV